MNKKLYVWIFFGNISLAIAIYNNKTSKSKRLNSNVDSLNIDSNIGANYISSSDSYSECTLNQNIKNNGFHRELVTEVILEKNGANIIDTATCIWALVEHFPPGMYVDLYQLTSQEEFGGPEALSGESIDVELPSHLSPSHKVYFFVKTHRKHTLNISFPIHLRYHRPRLSEDRVVVFLQPPTVLLRCPISPSMVVGGDVEAPCDKTNQEKCLWRKLSCHSDNRNQQLHVPVGKLEHFGLCVYVTVFLTGGCTLFLAYAIITKDTFVIGSDNTT